MQGLWLPFGALLVLISAYMLTDEPDSVFVTHVDPTQIMH